MEILEDKTQGMAIRYEHVHLAVPEAEIPKVDYRAGWSGESS